MVAEVGRKGADCDRWRCTFSVQSGIPTRNCVRKVKIMQTGGLQLSYQKSDPPSSRFIMIPFREEIRSCNLSKHHMKIHICFVLIPLRRSENLSLKEVMLRGCHLTGFLVGIGDARRMSAIDPSNACEEGYTSFKGSAVISWFLPAPRGDASAKLELSVSI